MNRAPREELLRIPGIGARNVSRILSMRSVKSLRVVDLKRLRIAWSRARAFVIAADHNPHLQLLEQENLRKKLEPQPKQLLLFDLQQDEPSSEL